MLTSYLSGASQNEILQDFLIEKPSLYRMILRYVNLNDETVLAKVTLSPENPNDAEQSYLVRMEPTKEPKSVTVAGPSGNLPTPFILNPGTWTSSIATNKSLFLDYFALLPAAYYEATILQEKVLKPCSVDQQQTSCRHFAYPSLAKFVSVRGQRAYLLENDTPKSSATVTDSRVKFILIHFCNDLTNVKFYTNSKHLKFETKNSNTFLKINFAKSHFFKNCKIRQKRHFINDFTNVQFCKMTFKKR